MEFDKIEQAIDELYLLHKKAEERGGHQEVQHQQRLDELRAETRALQKERGEQRQCQREMNDINQRIESWYARIFTIGVGIAALIAIGLVVLGLIWHHVNSQISQKQQLVNRINTFYSSISILNNNNKTYIRVIPNTEKILTTEKGASGTYAQLDQSGNQE